MHKIGPYDLGKVHLGDCVSMLRDIPSGSIHTIISDPPFGNGQTHVRRGNLTARGKVENDEEDLFRALMPKFLVEAARVLDADSSALLLFSEGGGPLLMSNRLSDWIDSYLEFVTTLIWDKGIPGMGHYYRRSHEFIFVGRKRGSKLRWFDESCAAKTVIHVTRIVNPPEGSHPTPKPVSLMEYLIRNHTKKGDVVCDPFSGGGSTGVAAKRLGRKFVGFEIDPHWAEYSNRRIALEGEQGELFA